MRSLVVLVISVGACAELEPVRPMPAVVDPASTAAPEAHYRMPPDELAPPRAALRRTSEAPPPSAPSASAAPERRP